MLLSSYITPKVVQRLTLGGEYFLSALPRPLFYKTTAAILNRSFRQPILQGDLNFLLGRYVCVDIPDLTTRFSVTLSENRLKVGPSHRDGAVTVKANADTLLLLVTGKADPDTLFFRRQLMITGDTEVGLSLKNFLDTLDAKNLMPAPVYAALDILSKGVDHGKKGTSM